MLKNRQLHIPTKHQFGIKFMKDHDMNLTDITDQFEISVVVQACERTNWNYTQAAKLLKINRTTLMMKLYKMREYGLIKPDQATSENQENTKAENTPDLENQNC